jgi:hypothetical protein
VGLWGIPNAASTTELLIELGFEVTGVEQNMRDPRVLFYCKRAV